jgi:hypothetical protein
MKFSEIVQLCFTGLRTGRIEIVNDGELGHVFVDGGQIKHASFGTLEGMDAFFALYRLEETDCSFESMDVHDIKTTVTTHFDHLLLEAAKRKDECNTPLEFSTEVSTSTNPAQYKKTRNMVSNKPRLIPLTDWGSKVPIEIPLDRTKLGRSEENPLYIPHNTLSRDHCEFHVEEKEVIIRDLDSLNGISINGVPILEAHLQHGDILQIGALFFRFEFDIHLLKTYRRDTTKINSISNLSQLEKHVKADSPKTVAIQSRPQKLTLQKGVSLPETKEKEICKSDVPTKNSKNWLSFLMGAIAVLLLAFIYYFLFKR